jgi:hypothetical protein
MLTKKFIKQGDRGKKGNREREKREERERKKEREKEKVGQVLGLVRPTYRAVEAGDF